VEERPADRASAVRAESVPAAKKPEPPKRGKAVDDDFPIGREDGAPAVASAVRNDRALDTAPVQAPDANRPDPNRPERSASATESSTESSTGASIDVPLRFDENEFQPGRLEQKTVRSIKQFIADCSGDVTVVGHTSNTGSTQANHYVGLRRAHYTRRYLISEGAVDGRVVKVKSMRDSEPVASNDDEEGRRRNRRVIVQCDP
jgi:outer membrane protein OmpA-like peptidoglycan-associated protein